MSPGGDTDGTPPPGLEHATVVEVAGRGVIIRGPSGSGKTSLAIELMHRCRASAIPSALVADDYVFVSADPDDGALRAEVPERIAGLIEFRGYGVVPVALDRFKHRTRLSLAVALCEPGEAERVSDRDRDVTIAGVALPELALLRHSPVSSTYAILGWLGLSDKAL